MAGANAQLISAAPELLAACRLFVDETVPYLDALEAARAAIGKAVQ